MSSYLKKIMLTIRKCRRYIKKRILRWISNIILVMCVILFILSVYSNVAHRMPLLSFFAEEMRLPYKLELAGTVNVSDGTKEIDIPITVSVGGYSVGSDSGEAFKLSFSGLNKDSVPIIISFEYRGNKYVKIEYIDYGKDYYKLCEYEYILGE